MKCSYYVLVHGEWLSFAHSVVFRSSSGMQPHGALCIRVTKQQLTQSEKKITHQNRVIRGILLQNSTKAQAHFPYLRCESSGCCPLLKLKTKKKCMHTHRERKRTHPSIQHMNERKTSSIGETDSEWQTKRKDRDANVCLFIPIQFRFSRLICDSHSKWQHSAADAAAAKSERAFKCSQALIACDKNDKLRGKTTTMSTQRQQCNDVSLNKKLHTIRCCCCWYSYAPSSACYVFFYFWRPPPPFKYTRRAHDIVVCVIYVPWFIVNRCNHCTKLMLRCRADLADIAWICHYDVRKVFW